MANMLKIITFAGHPVTEDGLILSPPQGGEFTVWPDGGYAYTPPEGRVILEPGASVSTFYSYVMEDVDGEVTVRTFALTPGEEAIDPMPDFQSWSLDDILALDDAVGLSVDGHGPVAEFIGGDAGADLDLSVDAADFSVDVLEHVIKTSYES